MISSITVLTVVMLGQVPGHTSRLFTPSTGSGSAGTVTAPATGAGTDTCTGNGCAIGPVGASTDGGVTIVGSDLTFPTVDRGIVFNHGEKLVGDSSGIYLSNTGTKVLACASAGGCALGILSRRFSDLYVDSIHMGAAGALNYSGTAPTISSGFGTSPSITAGNAVAFRLNVGTGGVATTGVVALPTASNGWNCTAGDVTTPDSFDTQMTASTTSTASFKNYSRTTGLAIAWTASDILAINCVGF